MVVIKSTIESVVFSNPENGYVVLKIKEDDTDNIYTAVGCMADASAGKALELQGEWITHSKYGEQLQFKSYYESLPTNVKAIQQYLSGGIFTGIGPIIAEKITDHFGQNTLKIIDETPDLLYQVYGVGKKKVQSLIDAWAENRDLRQLIVFLNQYDISSTLAFKIHAKYGSESIARIQINPYNLVYDIKGIGFITADQIALKMGMPEDSTKRIEAAIVYALERGGQEGHCYLKYDQISEYIEKLLKKTVEIDQALHTLDEEDKIRIIVTNKSKDLQKSYFYLTNVIEAEMYVAQKLNQLLKFNATMPKEIIDHFINQITSDQDIILSDEQLNAVTGLANHPVAVLTGGPGVGKTTTLKCLVQLFKKIGFDYQLAAPTGRAAQRMGEVIGEEAYTLHRLLQINHNNETLAQVNADVLIVDESSMIDLFVMRAVLSALVPSTRLILIGDIDQLPSVGVGNILNDIIDSQVIPVYRLTKIFRQAEESYIIKAAHMINKGKIPNIVPAFKESNDNDLKFFDAEEPTKDELNFFNRVRTAIYQAKEKNQSVLVTDHKKTNAFEFSIDQQTYTSQSINDARELIKTKKYPNQMLIPTQFLHCNISSLLQSKNKGALFKEILGKIHPYSSLYKGYTASDFIIQLYSKIIPSKMQNAEIQILCPMKRGSLGVFNTNERIQNAVNPHSFSKNETKFGDTCFREGDRVMQTKNNYGLNVFNGDVGKIVSIDNEAGTLDVMFSINKQLVTYQKKQLSELELAYACTIHKSQGSEYDIVIIPIHTQSFMMLQRNLVYTAITRAKKLAIFVGTRKALAMSVLRNDYKQRQTLLKELLNP